MKCPIQVGEETELLAYSSGKLESSRAAALKPHVETCSACREYVAAQRAVWEALDAWESPAPAADFDRRLYRRIEQEQDAVWWVRWLRPLVARRGLPIAAAACLVVAIGIVLERPTPSPVPQPLSAEVQSLQPDQVDHALDDMKMLSDFTRAARSDAGEL